MKRKFLKWECLAASAKQLILRKVFPEAESPTKKIYFPSANAPSGVFVQAKFKRVEPLERHLCSFFSFVRFIGALAASKICLLFFVIV
jgi:hypothetical protein